MAITARFSPGPIEKRRREQWRFKLTGRWSTRVVDERLRIYDRDSRIDRE